LALFRPRRRHDHDDLERVDDAESGAARRWALRHSDSCDAGGNCRLRRDFCARRIALVHCVLAFFFNSAVLALSINIAAGMV
jgi:hypothetical protein